MFQPRQIKHQNIIIISQLIFLLGSLSLLSSCVLLGRNNDGPPEIRPDTSRPTSLYSQIQISPQWERNSEGANLFGLKGNFSKAWSENRHQVTGGIFRLYNDQTGKFGSGDGLIRYMGTLRNNADSAFGSLAGFLDVSIPTGNYDDGLGASRWAFSPGIMGNLTFNPKFELFPAISYTYATSPTAEAIADEDKTSSHDLTLGTTAVIKFDSWFLWVTPTLAFQDLNGNSHQKFKLEIRPSIMVADGRIQLGTAFSRDFENRSNSVKAFVGIIR